MTYADKLKDPRWQRKRLEVLQHADFRCQLCGSKDNTLHVHHAYYEKGRDPWEYPVGAMISLCHDCHARQHKGNDDLEKARAARDHFMSEYRKACAALSSLQKQRHSSVAEAGALDPEGPKFKLALEILEREMNGW